MSAQRRNICQRLTLLLFLSLPQQMVLAGDPLSYQELTQLPQPPAVEPIAYGPDKQQFGELRLPAADIQAGVQQALPVVVILHGGCWFSEYDIAHIRPLAQAITKLGYATWTLEYRRVGEDGGAWPGTFNDVAAGTDYLRQLAQKYPLDLDAVVALGHSAGGQLALWLASRQKRQTQMASEHTPLALRAVIGLAAAADLDLLAHGGECDHAASQLLGGMPEQYPERYRAFSPQHLVPLNLPQILINGALDHTWSPIADSYYRAAVAAGDPVRRWTVPEAAHFDLVAPQAPVWPYIEQALQDLFMPDTADTP